MASNHKKLIRKYIDAGGFCYWCRRHTILVVPWGFINKNGQIIDKAGRGGWQKSGIYKKNLNITATVDHFIDRVEGIRFQVHDGTKQTVLACWKCNALRCKEANKKHGHKVIRGLRRNCNSLGLTKEEYENQKRNTSRKHDKLQA